MKKSLLIATMIVSIMLPGIAGAHAPHDDHDYGHDANTAAPIVSIGVGNGNVPANISPMNGSVYGALIPVYATILDNDLENYHFRVIKDGGAEGHTCRDLFIAENQGYASTTRNASACGFVFNQSVYVSTPNGFSNSLIATLTGADLAAFGGEGDYWLILGARDEADNRTSDNYLNDARVKITIDNTAPTTTLSVAQASTSASIVLTGTSTDAHNIVSVNISASDFNGTACGAFLPVASIPSASASSSFSWEYSWTPSGTGAYCVKAISTDEAGNTDEGIIASNMTFIQPVAALTAATAEGEGSSSHGRSHSSSRSSDSATASTSTGMQSDASGTALTKLAKMSANISASGALVTINPASTSTTTDNLLQTSDASSQLAGAAFSNIVWNWYWLIVAVFLLAVLRYFSFSRNNQK